MCGVAWAMGQRHAKHNAVEDRFDFQLNVCQFWIVSIFRAGSLGAKALRKLLTADLPSSFTSSNCFIQLHRGQIRRVSVGLLLCNRIGLIRPHSCRIDLLADRDPTWYPLLRTKYVPWPPLAPAPAPALPPHPPSPPSYPLPSP